MDAGEKSFIFISDIHARNDVGSLRIKTHGKTLSTNKKTTAGHQAFFDGMSSFRGGSKRIPPVFFVQARYSAPITIYARSVTAYVLFYT